MPLNLITKTPVSEKLSPELESVVAELAALDSKRACLERAYEILTERYRGRRVETYTKFFDIFIYDAGKLWAKKGFLHCTNMNFLLRTLLVRSGHFTEDDMRLRWCMIWYLSPHQYVQVKIGNEWVEVDIWGHDHGIALNDHAHGFH